MQWGNTGSARRVQGMQTQGRHDGLGIFNVILANGSVQNSHVIERNASLLKRFRARIGGYAVDTELQGNRGCGICLSVATYTSYGFFVNIKFHFGCKCY